MKLVWVRNRREYEALSDRERETRHRAFDAIHEMRRGEISLSEAARRAGTTPLSVHRYAGDLLTREGSSYRATASDRSYQRMAVLSTEGLVDVDTRGSRVRSMVGRHWNAIGRFAGTGDVRVLEPFRGKRVGGVELASDVDTVEEYLRRGEINVDDIYLARGELRHVA
jgi:hypothetical protein